MPSSALKLYLPVAGALVVLGSLWLLPGSPSPAPSAQAEVGIALAKSGRYPEGLALLRQALTNEPHLFRAHYGLGMIAFQAKRYEEAEQELRAAAECPGVTSDSLFMWGVVLQTQNRLKEALPIYQEVVKQRPNEPSYVYNLGMLAKQLGDTPLARRHLTTYLRLAPRAADRKQVEQALADLKGV